MDMVQGIQEEMKGINNITVRVDDRNEEMAKKKMLYRALKLVEKDIHRYKDFANRL